MTARHRKSTTTGGNTVLDLLRKLNSTSTKRAVRTAIDGALGVLAVVVIVIPALSDFGVSVEGELKVAALVAATTVVISKIKNKLEELGYLGAFLKDNDN